MGEEVALSPSGASPIDRARCAFFRVANADQPPRSRCPVANPLSRQRDLPLHTRLDTGIVSYWLGVLVKLLQIMGANLSQPHILEEIGERRRSGGREERVFRRHNYWLHAPVCTLNK